MDLSTIIGLLVGWGLVMSAILSSPGWGFFFDFGAALIVIGGTTGSIIMNFPFEYLIRMPAVLTKTFLHKAPSTVDTISQLVSIAEKARREGILAIERELAVIEDDFMRDGIRLAVDGTDPETIRTILEIDLATSDSRHQMGKGLLKGIATYAPAFGMIGTLIGLIQMLQALDDPSQIGIGMANALVTTFYGAIIANLFAIPLVGKLDIRNREEMERRELVVEGILSIQSGDNPRVVQDKLNTFLAPGKRVSED
ncbi:MAG: motility protein A [Candidatus Delongbacteria bacterium]|nr:motility protein A [Candidatus Delongbacteria bacterium]